ncbi:MAG: hypothetical protein ABI589_01105 [Burkholderiales bacterium]
MTMSNNSNTPRGADSSPESVDALKRVGEDLKAKAASSAREVRAVAERDAARFAEIAREWWQNNAQSASEAAQAAKAETAAWQRRTESYVRDEPIKAVAIAAAVGALVAALWVGKRRD